MSAPTASRHHADWLSLVEVSGPFVSLPVLLRVFAQGLEPRDPSQAKVLRAAYEEWQDNPSASGKQRAWVLHVLTALLGYPANQVVEGQALPAGLEAKMPEVGETIRPDFALIGPAGSDTTGQAQLLIASYPAEQKLDRPVIGRHWKATPATRMMELLHGAGVPLGLITNGEQWMLVYAPRGEVTGYASWFGALWMDEPITLRAFHSLLGVRRFFGVSDDSTLLALLKESANDQQEVTDQLGFQVREAVEVLVQSFDAIDKDSNRILLKGVSPAVQYEAALTIMMRLVFLFSAEERGLLHLGKPLYDNNYAVSTLQEQLQEVADLYGEEVLERRTDAWARLLSSFRAVHGGVKHQDLLMQAYGGSLFDPDRYPFLEGRPANSRWRNSAAEPLTVNNRVVLHLLSSLQRLRTKVGAGGITENRRISFRALGIEQIGHVYEGLLDHTGVRATEPIVGIKGTRNSDAEISLAQLESLLSQGQDKLIGFLKEETGRSLSALRKALDEGSLLDEHKLFVASGHDDALLARLRPFSSLIRADSFGRPLVVLDGSVYVTAGATRRNTGTHYTPPSLTEPIVRHTLEPLVYLGPAEGASRDQWKLKSPKEILDLRVCDMAMGSGAFLVQACRYLAERLTEAWENEERKHPGQVLITPDGKFSEGSPSERLVPADTNERFAIARRVVADRCLYGVDLNPMAVEMAKLSLWLITVDASRPFTFLDHALKCGDSLIGINSSEQLMRFSIRPGGGAQKAFESVDLQLHIDQARLKRLELEALPSDTPEQISKKRVLFVEAEDLVKKLSVAADLLLSVELLGLKGKSYEAYRETVLAELKGRWSETPESLQNFSKKYTNGRSFFHWALHFPEIECSQGFDALIGNPPFVGGKKLSGVCGVEYRDFLVVHIGAEVRGGADLCVYFVLRANSLVRPNGGLLGLVTTNSIAQGDSREVGLDQLTKSGSKIFRAIPSTPWPGSASLEIAQIWMRRGDWLGPFILDGNQVEGITAFLTQPNTTEGNPIPLEENSSKSFIGTYVLGMGFVLSHKDAEELLTKSPKSQNVILPYLSNDDLNTNPDQSASRSVINFFDWPLNRDEAGDWSSASEDERKSWLKNSKVPHDYPFPVASDFPECLELVERNVKPERTRKKEDGTYALRHPLYEKWWIYADKRPALYAAIRESQLVLVRGRITPTAAFVFVSAKQVLDANIVAFASCTYFEFACLQSSIHHAWADFYTPTFGKSTFVYAPSHCFENFPFPSHSESVRAIGEVFHNLRRDAMLSRNEGLTKIYNRFHKPQEIADDISRLRLKQVEMDVALLAAYGWQDLSLNHGFHDTKQGIRFAISEVARREVLERLLALNHKRSAEEKAAKLAESLLEHKPKRVRNSKESVKQFSLDI